MSVKQIILIIVLVALFLCASLVAQTIEPQVDEYINAQMKLGRFSGAVLVAKDGEILLSKGYGMANYELDVPNNPDMKFRLGSVTKQFTAMAIMILQSNGSLDVTDNIAKYIPDYPNGERITTHHLLTHTSGIADFTDMDILDEVIRDELDIEEIINFFKNEPLDFEPGEKYDYCNSGYVLLSYLIKIISGKSYAEFVTENIFVPLEMKDSGYDNHSAIIKNRAAGYFPAGDGIINAPYINMNIAQGGGGLYSTVNDLFKWDRAIAANKLLNKELTRIMLTPYTGTYCYGWRKVEEHGRTCFRHGGTIEGFKCEIQRFTDDDACIVVLSNFIHSPTRDIARDLSAILFGEEYEIPIEQKSVQVDPAILQTYAGSYEFAPGNNLTVTVKDGRIYIAPPGQPDLEIFAETETNFFAKAFPAKINFCKDESGNVTELIFNAGGREMKATKL